jgi:Protein of unknown function (DUF1538)
MGVLLKLVLGSVRDLAPILLVIVVFQVLVLEQPLADLQPLAQGALLVVAGLTLFIYGLELALFPMGDALAHALARRGSVWLLVGFAFLLGFGTTFAEPALKAVAAEAADAAAAAGNIADATGARDAYTLGLRFTVALAVGAALVLGVMRIVLGWPLARIIIGGYLLVVLITFAAPPEIVAVAYDTGGVTTSTVTVPLVTALGVGLASSLGGRNPLTDGFGLIAFASLTPMIFVMAYGIFVTWI